MKTIGLIGGMSWESSAEYYRLINQGMKSRLGGHHNARSILLTVDFQEVEELQHHAQWEQLGLMMQSCAKRLEAAGAEMILLCTNTMHKLAPQIEAATSVPFLHIADAAAQSIQAAGFTQVGLLGTRFTMEEDFYRKRLKEKFGIDVLIPEQAEREEIHRVIYDELCHGKIFEWSRHKFQHAIANLKQRGARAVVLGCTEIPLLIQQADSELPIFDTTKLHAEAAVAFALK